MITVWRFCEAPEELRKLSTNGGDEDWLAVLPPTMASDYIPWIESSGFGCAGVYTHNHPTQPGYIVKIGCHS